MMDHNEPLLLWILQAHHARKAVSRSPQTTLLDSQDQKAKIHGNVACAPSWYMACIATHTFYWVGVKFYPKTRTCFSTCGKQNWTCRKPGIFQYLTPEVTRCLPLYSVDESTKSLTGQKHETVGWGFEMNAMMREVTHSDFTEFLKEHKEAIVKSSRINMGWQKKIGNYQPEQFELERTNAWSFPERGRWATHQGNSGELASSDGTKCHPNETSFRRAC